MFFPLSHLESPMLRRVGPPANQTDKILEKSLMITSGKLKILRDKSKSPNKKQSNSMGDLQYKDKASSIVQLEENNKVIFAQLQSSEEEILNLSKKASNSEKSWTELKKHNEQLTAQPERSVTETSAIDYRK